MSHTDSRRYANTNANSRISRPSNWGSDLARDYRPVGQRYGSVLVLSGPKRKQTGTAVRKPIPRPVHLPSQRKDRHAEGSLLSSKQSRPDDTSQQSETTLHSHSHNWQNSSGTWNTPPDNSSRTDQYGFPIRSEVPINAREFPTLAASKNSSASKHRSPLEQADAYFTLDDRDTLPSKASDRGFGSRDENRPDSRQDWRSGRTSRDGEGRFRDDVENRLFSNNRSHTESRRGAFGFHTQDADRGMSGSRMGVPMHSNPRGHNDTFSGAMGNMGRTSSHGGGSRLEDYGLRGVHSGGSHAEKSMPIPKAQDDYVGTASQLLGTNSVFSSTLLAAGVAPPAALTNNTNTKVEESDSEEDAELAAHYQELELIKAEEEEKDRQRALAAEAGNATGEGPSSDPQAKEDAGLENEGSVAAGGSWEDAADDSVDALPEESMGLKPVDPQKWMQRQAEIEAEDRERRERAEAKKRELEEAIARREEEKARAAREASEAALAALAAASQPLNEASSNVVVPPPPPPPRKPQQPMQTSTPLPVDNSSSSADRPAAASASERESSDMVAPETRRQDYTPAPVPEKPAWGQVLYAQDAPQHAKVDASQAAFPPPPPLICEMPQEHVHSQPDAWQSDSAHAGVMHGKKRISKDNGHVDAVHSRRGDGAHEMARGRGRRGRGDSGRPRGPRQHHSAAVEDTVSSNTSGGFPGPAGVASDADAAAVAAAAKAAKTMENYMMPLPAVRKPDLISQSPDNGSKAPVLPPRDQPSAFASQCNPAVFDPHYSSEVELLQARTMRGMDHDDKGHNIFDGGDMGENLLPSNILGIDDTPYPANKPSKPHSESAHHHEPFSMHDTSFSPSLDNKNMSPMAHPGRSYTRSDHSAPIPLSSAHYPPHSQPRMVSDCLPPEHSPLWAVSREWDSSAHSFMQPNPTGDIHLHHHNAFAPVSTNPVSYISSPPKATRHQSAPSSVPTSNPVPVFRNPYGFPGNSSVFGMPTYPANSQLHVPLVPTSKAPDWSNNGPTAVPWNAIPPPQTQPVTVLPPASVPASETQNFQVTAGTTFPTNCGPMPSPAIPVSQPNHSQHLIRLSDLEAKLPENLGLGTSPPIHRPRLAPNQASPQPAPAQGLNARSRGNHARGGRGSGSNTNHGSTTETNSRPKKPRPGRSKTSHMGVKDGGKR